MDIIPNYCDNRIPSNRELVQERLWDKLSSMVFAISGYEPTWKRVGLFSMKDDDEMLGKSNL